MASYKITIERGIFATKMSSYQDENGTEFIAKASYAKEINEKIRTFGVYGREEASYQLKNIIEDCITEIIDNVTEFREKEELINNRYRLSAPVFGYIISVYKNNKNSSSLRKQILIQNQNCDISAGRNLALFKQKGMYSYRDLSDEMIISVESYHRISKDIAESVYNKIKTSVLIRDSLEKFGINYMYLFDYTLRKYVLYSNSVITGKLVKVDSPTIKMCNDIFSIMNNRTLERKFGLDHLSDVNISAKDFKHDIQCRSIKHLYSSDILEKLKDIDENGKEVN